MTENYQKILSNTTVFSEYKEIGVSISENCIFSTKSTNCD